MRVELRIEARWDLVDAAEFYDKQRVGLGDYFFDCVYMDLKKLESQAGIHELAFGFRRKLVKRFPFAIYYLVSETVVDVAAILDCRSNPVENERRLKRRS